MPLKILLLYPPIGKNDRAGRLSGCAAVMPGLGLLYIGAILRENSFDVQLIDAESLNLTLDETSNRIYEQKPDIIGITSTTMSINSALMLVSMLKDKLTKAMIFLGGPHVTALPEDTLKSQVLLDGCFIGDSENAFLKVAKNLEVGLAFYEGVDGLAYRKGDLITVNPKQEHFDKIDSLPFPAWDLLDGFPHIYSPPFHSYHRLPLANIITTRGCPFRCTFCDRSVFGQKLFSHSNEYVIEMIQELITDYGIKEISIKDDMFTFSKRRVLEFCQMLRGKNIKIAWNCNARVNSVDIEMLTEMKKAGCWLISYGIESGSDKMLEKMDKRITKKQVINTLSATRSLEIASKGFFMLGIPGETEETLRETSDFIKRLPLDELSINFFTPFPGSKLFNEALADGFNVDFAKMNMQELVYCPTSIDPKILKTAMQKIIYKFYLKPERILRYVFRGFGDYYEFLRFFRMTKAFTGIVFNRWM